MFFSGLFVNKILSLESFFKILLFFVVFFSFPFFASAAPTSQSECKALEPSGVCRISSCNSGERQNGLCNLNGRICCELDPDSAPQPSSPTTPSSFNYTPLETIPGTEGMDTSTLKGFLEGLFLFVMWSAGVASMFMIVIGGFWYMTSAGNTARVGEAKKIITNALLGLIVVLIAWLLLYVINPDLVKVDLSSLEVLFIEGTVTSSYPQKKGVVGPGGSGTCGDPVNSGNCSVSNMQACSAWNPEAASRICQFESNGGNAFATSGSDKCADGSSFSFGIFQVNIIANGERLGGGCDPTIAFSKANGSPLGSSRGNNGGALQSCTNSKGVRYTCKWNCKVANQAMYETCKQAAYDTARNIQVGCDLYQSGGWKHWPVTKKLCNL